MSLRLASLWFHLGRICRVLENPRDSFDPIPISRYDGECLVAPDTSLPAWLKDNFWARPAFRSAGPFFVYSFSSIINPRVSFPLQKNPAELASVRAGYLCPFNRIGKILDCGYPAAFGLLSRPSPSKIAVFCLSVQPYFTAVFQLGQFCSESSHRRRSESVSIAIAAYYGLTAKRLPMEYPAAPPLNKLVSIRFKLVQNFMNQEKLTATRFGNQFRQFTSVNKSTICSLKSEADLHPYRYVDCTFQLALSLAEIIGVDIYELWIYEVPAVDEIRYRAPIIAAITLLSRAEAPTMRDDRCAKEWLAAHPYFKAVAHHAGMQEIIHVLAFRGHLVDRHDGTWAAYSIPDDQLFDAIKERSVFERHWLNKLLDRDPVERRRVASRVATYLERAKSILPHAPHHLIRYDELIHAELVRDRHRHIIYAYRLVSRQLFAVWSGQYLNNLSDIEAERALEPILRVHEDFYKWLAHDMAHNEIADPQRGLDLYDAQTEALYDLAQIVIRLPAEHLRPSLPTD